MPVLRGAASAICVLAAFSDVLLASRPCVDSDWQFGFTECVEDTTGGKSRGVFAYPPDPGTCDALHASSRPLPEPLLGVPCQEPCEAGSRWAIDLTHEGSGTAVIHQGCRACARGRFSLGGGVAADGAAGDWARPWPLGLGSFCLFRGSDNQWHTGLGAPLLCVLHFRRAALAADLPAETRPGTWNVELPERELDLQLVLAPGDALACTRPNGEAAAALRGVAVLVLRGNCTFQTKTEHLEAVGALAVVVYNNLFNGGFFSPAAANASAVPGIPIFMVTRETGERWRAIMEGPQHSARLHVPSTRCSATSLEAFSASNSSAEALARESWDLLGEHRGCSPWTSDPTGRFLHSGDNLHFHWLHSVLTLGLRFVRDGRLRFRYIVDAEDGFDGLTFQMDQAEKMPMVSRQAMHRDFQVEVPRGVHTFSWIYSKDYSTTVGDDRAKLELLEVTGTAHADLECRSCRGASGHGDRGCEACGRDSYLEVRVAGNTTACRPCPAELWSVPGSVGIQSCHARRACMQQDMERSYSAFEIINGSRQAVRGESCRRNQALVSYSWRRPTTCDPTRAGSVPLPQPSVEPCPACQPHETRPTGGACKSVTKTCPQGSYQMRELVVSHWYTWPNNFSTEVWGEMATADGEPFGRDWRLEADGSAVAVGTAFSSGVAELWAALSPEAHVDSAFLHLDVALYNPGNLSFYLESKPTGAWGRAGSVSVNGTRSSGVHFQGDASHGAPHGLFLVTLPLPVGLHRITWSWHYHSDLESTDEGMDAAVSGLRILNVSVLHAVGAGTSKCERCPAGFEVGADALSCKVCAAGRSSIINGSSGVTSASACMPCPAGRAASAGAAVCHECGPGLHSDVGATHCVPQPLVGHPARPGQPVQQWDTSALVQAWRDGNPTVGATGSQERGGLRTVRVEDRWYYLDIFAPGPRPGGGPPAGGRPTAPGTSTGTPLLAYWWEHLPAQGTPIADTGAASMAVCNSSDAHIRSVANVFESLKPAAQDEALGLWATFSGTCTTVEARQHRVRQARLFLRCDPSALLGHPGNPFDTAAALLAAGNAHETSDLSFVEGQRPDSPHSCEDVALEWHTSFACPLCREEDFVAVATSGCQAGKGQRIEYVRKVPCTKGTPRPEAYWEPCSGDASLVIAFVVVPVALVLCCIVSYVVTLRRHYSKYMKLEEEQTGSAPPARIGAPTLS